MIERLGRPARRVFDVTSGIPQSSVYSIELDARGYLWVGTEDGVARYNGREWSAYSMPNANVSNMLLDIKGASDGAVWFATRGGGLVRLNGETWTALGIEDGLPSDIVTCLLPSRADAAHEILYVGTPAGLVRYRHGRLEAVALPETSARSVIRSLCESVSDEGTTLWVGMQDGAVVELAPNATVVHDVANVLSTNGILSLEATRDGDGTTTIWAGTSDEGLFAYRSGRWSPIAPEMLGSHRINVICPTIDPSGELKLWVGTYDGLFLVERGGVRYCDWLSGIASKSILDLRAEAIGATQMLWLGLDGGGLLRFRLDRWSSFDGVEELRNCLVMAIHESTHGGASDYWLGAEYGLVAVRSDGKVEEARAEASNTLTSIAESRGPDGAPRVWVGFVQGGAFRFRDGSLELVESAASREVTAMLADKRDAAIVWLGAKGEIARLDTSRLECATLGTELPDVAVKSLHFTTLADGTEALVVGTYGGGIVFVTDERLVRANVESGLPNDFILSLHESTASDGSRRLWIGTASAGAAWCDLSDFPNFRWTTISETTTPRLPSNSVVSIEEDASGALYFFTGKGVARLSFHDGQPRLYTFTSEDGLPSNECNTGASLVDSRGRLWAGTVGGAAVYDPAKDIGDTTPKPLYITKLTVNGRRTRFDGEIVLTHDENNLVFEFDLLSYFREADTRYQTQLVGFEEVAEWHAEPKRIYTNLAAGRYCFKVWGRDYAGNVSGPVEVVFRIKPAPWRTWWAMAGYGVLAAGATAGAVQLRLATLRKRNLMLEETVRQQTAELAEKVEQLEESEAVARERADELAVAVDQLRELERRAQEARIVAVEAKDRAVEASQAKSQFLSSMSHELRTPLNAVLGFAQLLERDPELSADQREHLSAITTSGEHLLHLINDVLSLSKIEAGKQTFNPQRFDLHRLLEGVEMMLRGRTRQKRLALRVERSAALPRFVVGDEGKIRQVLINLLGNAVKFTESGHVTLRARWRDEIGEFEVEDTGAGIDAAELEGLFEPFVQSRSGRESREGTGLGLAISRNFARMMGGDLRATSEVGRGSTFYFDCELPADETLVEDETRHVVVDIVQTDREHRILVVDDAEKNRALLVQLLGRVGFVVAEARDGREAIALFDGWRPDAIVMDVRMPVLDGKEATRRIRAIERDGDREAPACKIIALTASVFEDEREEILAAGFDDFLMKPFREVDIFGSLARLLDITYREITLDQVPSSGNFAASRREHEAFDGLRALPAAVVDSLRDAVVKGDVEIANRIADELHPLDAELAAAIRALLRSYKFDELQEHIERSLG